MLEVLEYLADPVFRIKVFIGHGTWKLMQASALLFSGN